MTMTNKNLMKATTTRTRTVLAAIHAFVLHLIDESNTVTGDDTRPPAGANASPMPLVRAEAAAVLMTGFELFYTTPAAQAALLASLASPHEHEEGNSCGLARFLHGPLPPSKQVRNFLVQPLLARLAQDTLIVRFLPLAGVSEASVGQGANDDRDQIAGGKVLLDMLDTLVERISWEISAAATETRDLADADFDAGMGNGGSALRPVDLGEQAADSELGAEIFNEDKRAAKTVAMRGVACGAGDSSTVAAAAVAATAAVASERYGGRFSSLLRLLLALQKHLLGWVAREVQCPPWGGLTTNGDNDMYNTPPDLTNAEQPTSCDDSGFVCTSEQHMRQRLQAEARNGVQDDPSCGASDTSLSALRSGSIHIVAVES